VSRPVPQKPLLSNRNYNALKHVASFVLPAAATLYFALAQIWHFPDTEQVVGTITAVNTFLGVVLGISSLQYNNFAPAYVGSIDVTDDGQKKVYSLNLNAPPEHLETLSTATFAVNAVKTVPAPVAPVGPPVEDLSQQHP
jgi:hypothetical protein